MSYLRAYARNLLVIGLVLGGAWLFSAIFFPDVLKLLPMIGQIYSGLSLWPFIILGLLLFALPRRRR